MRTRYDKYYPVRRGPYKSGNEKKLIAGIKQKLDIYYGKSMDLAFYFVLVSPFPSTLFIHEAA